MGAKYDIKFKFDIDKVKNLFIILCKSIPGLDILKIVKLCYFIDKKYLLKYGRIITGDVYYKLPNGPVPTKIYDILKAIRGDRNHVCNDYLEVVNNVIKAERPDPKTNFITMAEPNLDVFSQSELDVIHSVLNDYNSTQALELADITHKEASFLKSSPNSPIDFYLFFEGEEISEDIISIMEEEQENRDFLESFK